MKLYPTYRHPQHMHEPNTWFNIGYDMVYDPTDIQDPIIAFKRYMGDESNDVPIWIAEGELVRIPYHEIT